MSRGDSGCTSQNDSVKSNGVCEMAQKFAYVRGVSPASSGTMVKLICLRSFMSLVSAHHPDHHTLNLHLVGRHENRLHRRVGGLEPDLPVLAIELLQRDVGAVEERDDHFAVVGSAPVFDDDVVAVANLLVDHRVALDAEDVGVALADEILGDGDRFAADDRLDGNAGGDVPEERQLDGPAAEARRDELDRAAAVPGALDEALFLQVGQVLVDRSERRQTETAADLLQAGRVAVLLDEIVEVVEDFPLTLGQWQHARTIRKQKAKVKSLPWQAYNFRPRRRV